MIRTMVALLAATLLATSTRAGEPLDANDRWRPAIGTTRSLENDVIGCATQRNVNLMNAARRNPGVAMNLPGCTFFLRDDRVVIADLETDAGRMYALIHLVGDARRYWVAAPVELYEAR
jgi:hypothetical protein